MKKIASIAEVDNTVYCITQAAHVMAFDVQTGKRLAVNTTSEAYELLVTQDGRLLGINMTTLFEFDPKTLNTTVLEQGFQHLLRLTQDPVTGLIYLFDGTEIVQVKMGENK